MSGRRLLFPSKLWHTFKTPKLQILGAAPQPPAWPTTLASALQSRGRPYLLHIPKDCDVVWSATRRLYPFRSLLVPPPFFALPNFSNQTNAPLPYTPSPQPNHPTPIFASNNLHLSRLLFPCFALVLPSFSLPTPSPPIRPACASPPPLLQVRVAAMLAKAKLPACRSNLLLAPPFACDIVLSSRQLIRFIFFACPPK